MIKIAYDKEGDLLEIRFTENKVKSSEHIETTGLVVDFDEAENIVAVEITSFSKRVGKSAFAEAAAL
jgi:uncharacterized protein YuzE